MSLFSTAPLRLQLGRSTTRAAASEKNTYVPHMYPHTGTYLTCILTQVRTSHVSSHSAFTDVLTNVAAGNGVTHVGLMEHCLAKITHCTKQVHHSVGNLRLERLTSD